MEPILRALEMLFGADGELRQIIALTLEMSFFSTLISSLLGIPLGVLLGGSEFRARPWLMRLTNTLMGLPPVVAGLVVYLVLSRSGPLGSLKLLFSVPAMVIAQVILITPIVTGMTAAIVSLPAPRIRETATGIGLTRWRQLLLMVYECRVQFLAVVLAAFGRSIAEVGAVQIVGGNIQHKTRVMTTAIMMQTNLGQFELAVVLGVLLLLISFAINIIVQRFQERQA
jgi:tungstate transport system permease protein